MTGYVRQSAADIVPTAVVRAAPINNEFNELRDVFEQTGGHRHDGSAAEGAYVPLISDADAFNKVAVNIVDNSVDVFIEVAGAAVKQLVVIDGAIVPVTDGDIDLGTNAKQFKDLYITGTANIDSLIADTADINAGTIDATVIGASSAQAITGTLITASTGFTGNLTGSVTGNTTGTHTGAVVGAVTGSVTGNVTATTGASQFNDVTINGGLNMDAGSAATITGLTTPTNNSDAATKLYVDTAISNLIDTAPTTLNTLNELAAALNDDPSFVTTITTSIATKLNLAGGTMSGAIAMGTNKITNLGTPTSNTDASTKLYVDNVALTKLPLAGGTMTGAIAMGNNKITDVGTPTVTADAATKGYVDGILGSATSAAISAAAAAVSASNALTSETNALNSANTSSTQAGNAASSASTATTQAGIATTQAGIATTQAGIATTQAAASAASAASAAAIVTGVASNRPSIRPSLLLDFSNTRVLDPRITFTRASTATFYDQTSTAVAEQNLLLQSQTFGTTWITTNGTLTTGILDPSSTTTATTLTSTSANTTVYQAVTLLALPYTISFYVQRVTGTGIVNLTLDGTSFTAITVTGSWIRYSATITPTAGLKTVGIQLVTSGDAINIWGAQLEQRSAVTSYTPTTTQTVTNYIPVLQTAASGVARFDCNPVTRESLGLLIEESRTNLLTYSEQFDNAVWVKTASTITANTVVSPDGILNGDKLVANNALSEHYFTQAFSYILGTSYTLSTYAKAGEYNFLQLTFGSGAFGGVTRAYFNLTAGTVGTLINSPTASIIPVGNGWYRCSITKTATATATVNTLIAVTSADNTLSFTGDGYSGIYIWGAQLEVGAFATSYTPTVASQVTRAADSASMTGTNFSSWYRKDEGSFLVDYQYGQKLAGIRTIAVSDGTANNFMEVAAATGAFPSVGVGSHFSVVINGTAEVTTTSGSVSAVANTRRLFAGAYKVNDYASCNNGGTLGVDTVATIPVVDRLYFSNNTNISSALINGYYRRVAYYPKRLTNTELQGLTS